MSAGTPRRAREARLIGALGAAWADVTALGRVAATRGQSAWLVGGGVRDLLLGRPVRDVDLVVEGDAMALAGAVAAVEGGEVLRHAAFGTAKWTPRAGATPLDLAGARTEAYPTPACLPVVTAADLGADLARRDFSVNAMAMGTFGVDAGVLRDPHGGEADLSSGVLRVLHPRSFVDDPTRVLRAARFAARFTMQLAPETAAVMEAARVSGAFGPLGRERLGAELERLLCEPQPVAALRRLGAWGFGPELLPGLRLDAPLFATAEAVIAGCAEASALAGGPPLPAADALWMCLAEAVPADRRAAEARLVPGGGERHARFRAGLGAVRAASAALEAGDPGGAGHLLRGLDAVALGALLALGGPEARGRVRWWLAEGRSVRLGLDGRDLLAAGIPAGPGVGRGLAAAWSVAWRGGDPAAQRAAAIAAALGLPRGP